MNGCKAQASSSSPPPPSSSAAGTFEQGKSAWIQDSSSQCQEFVWMDEEQVQPAGEPLKPFKGNTGGEADHNKLMYSVTEVPPWYLSIFLAVQHYLTAFGSNIAIPLILTDGLCLQHDGLTQSHLINTVFFVSGLCTIMQVTFGIRLPILQGGTFALLSPALAILSTPEFQCPSWTQNASLVNASSPVFIEVWQTRVRTGSIMLASLLQILVGFSGLVGFLMRFVGPLTIAPTIALIGLSVFDVAGVRAGSHWGISVMTAALIILFSQYLRFIALPFPTYSKARKLDTKKFYIFQTMPILLGITVSWLVCHLLTIYNVLPSEPDKYGHQARTDVKGDVVGQASWFVLPYPGQWGTPKASLAGVVGMMAGIVCSMAESVGDYHACAKLSGAPPPPKHAINRGIGMEGIGSLLAGAFGTGNGTTSFSENVAALGITKVGSRMVILLSAVVMILMGVLGKIGAVFSTIPNPVIGGMFLIMFGVIAATGISNLQSTDMNSSRNIFVFGFSLFSGLVIPTWIAKNPGILATGLPEVDAVLQILFSTHMFVGGFLGFFLDNTIPGTVRERGLFALDEVHLDNSGTMETEDIYNLPFGITTRLLSRPWVRKIPFCPWRGQDTRCKSDKGTSKKTSTEQEQIL
ncbi:solute carrier family 23 member 1-like isoform X2 [Syngnathoides biaculeatus]|uniref:solute carrier family 23 member 1-like isoform X2 n=1 Tax=Syngnathoides biaculeatus TaxID=300417 RepID=UPI002ADE5DFC|nr:solute carrier family 23 member 1-like isoform X2 [Syngnathoides biaculeatus]